MSNNAQHKPQDINWDTPIDDQMTGHDPMVLAQGTYRLKIIRLTRQTNARRGCPEAVVLFEHPASGVRFREWMLLLPQCMWKISNLFVAAGLPGKGCLPWDELEGKELQVVVGVNNVTGWNEAKRFIKPNTNPPLQEPQEDEAPWTEGDNEEDPPF